MMGFQPAVPLSGFTGWRFLQRTEDTQRAAFENSPQLKRDIEYFKEKIANITTAKDLVSDSRLLKVALGAFGLDEDINKQAYVLKVLSEGTESDEAFANRIVDKRYKDMAAAFGYGNMTGARVGLSDFAGKITEAYKTRQFEIALGDSDPDMRLAISFRREIVDFANSANADSAAWFSVMGNPPIKKVFEAAFQLPKDFGGLDVDRQRQIFRDKNQKLVGDTSLASYQNPENVDKLLQRFFLAKQLENGPSVGVRGSSALMVLQSAANGMANLFQSRL